MKWTEPWKHLSSILMEVMEEKQMTKKMSKELEQEFLFVLKRLQTREKAYWVQAKHIANILFGTALSGKEFRTNKMRVYRLGDRLEKQGLVKSERKRMQVGNSTGRSLIIFYHTDR